MSQHCRANPCCGDRNYDWNGHIGLAISFPHLTDEQMAGAVRMLMRNQVGHEGIVCGARDRIMCLVKEKAALKARISELESMLADNAGKP